MHEDVCMLCVRGKEDKMSMTVLQALYAFHINYKKIVRVLSWRKFMMCVPLLQ